MAVELTWDQAPQGGKKAKKRGQIEKISASEASRAVAWGGGKGAALSPSPDYLSADPAIFFFSPTLIFLLFSPNAEPGSRLPLNKPLDSRLWLNQ